MTPYLDAIRERVLVFDGAMGTTIQALDLPPGAFGGERLAGLNDHLSVSAPEVIRGIHRSYLEAGADVIETNTFGSNRPKLEEYGIGDRVREVNLAACRIARAAADEFARADGRPRFVAGSLGPTGKLPSSLDPALGAVRPSALSDHYAEQARALIDGGVDVLLIETGQDILEMKAAVIGCRRAVRAAGRPVPIQAQATLGAGSRMLLGTDIAAIRCTLEALRVDVIGLNCSTGPQEMADAVRYLCARARVPVSCIPNAGIPRNSGDGRAIYPLGPVPFAEELLRFVREFGVGVVGGCCGTTAEHIGELSRRVSGLPAPRHEASHVAELASLMTAVALHQEPRPLLVGERVNAQGSKKVKEALLRDDYETVVVVGREQAEGGAHVLDVCCALNEREDEAEQAAAVVKRLSLAVPTPLSIDTTEPAVVERALEQVPGRPLVNSIHLEGGRAKADRVLEIVREHGAAVIALTIDEQGMARTVDRKLAVARRIHEIAVREHGLDPSDLVFDALTFTLATGQEEYLRSAIATLDGIRAIKEALPGVFTILGVSNVSFGLKPAARAILNSVFLYHAVLAGLDLAIVNPSHVVPFAEIPADERALAEDLIFARSQDALAKLIAFFERKEQDPAGGSRARKRGLDASDLAAMPVERRIHAQILHRIADGIEAAIDEARNTHAPVEILNEVLLPAMKDVGDRFGAGELILPFVLQSAEVMKRAVRHLEQFLERTAGATKGTVVLATVFGDVHDIGKNLAGTIFANNGYRVVDLGKQVPARVIVEKARETGAFAVGLSALLVSTSKQMPVAVAELDRAGIHVPVLVGGAAINRTFARKANVLGGDGRLYDPGVFFCKDVFEGLEALNALTDPSRRDPFVREERRAALAAIQARADREERAIPGALARSDTPPAPDIPRPPFFGRRTVRRIPVDEVYALLDLPSLYRMSWGVRGMGRADYERLILDEFEPLRRDLQAEAARAGWIEPQAVYGYFPCRAAGDTVLVHDPGDPGREVARLDFPRQPGDRRLCVADYVREGDTPDDVIALQAVTVGPRADAEIARLNAAGEYTRAFYLHGLAVYAAEAAAEWLHRQIRHELGIPADRGQRYSPGYPSCPDLALQEILARLLGIADIGVTLTEAHQLVPEQSTSAIVVHHPAARYFTMREKAIVE